MGYIAKAFLSFHIILSPMVAAALTVSDTVVRRDVGILVLDSRNKPADGIFLYTSLPGDPGSRTDRNGHARLRGVSDSDTLWALLPSGTVGVPLAGQDSLKMKMKSGARYRIIYVKKQEKTTPVDELVDVQAILKTRPATSLAELLTGMVPGLSIRPSDDGFGYTSSIRGIHSIMQSSEPLVYIDGVEAGTFSDVNAWLNVRDIKSITVDKDAAIYGVKGGNGIIKIETICGSKSAL